MSSEIQAMVTLVNHDSKILQDHSGSSFKRESESNTSNLSKKKQRSSKNNRKRSKSFSGGGVKNMRPVPPTRFLLGGNIRDPLNLNSLQDEEVNRAMNAVTPKSSPIPTPPGRKGIVEVIIPVNINDPLNLINCADDAEFEEQLCSPVKKGRKKPKRKKRTSSGTSEVALAEKAGCSEAKTPDHHTDSAKVPSEEAKFEVPLPVERRLLLAEKPKRKSDEHKEAKKFKHCQDKIVSPVVPQPGGFWGKRSNSRRDSHHRVPPSRRRNRNPDQKVPDFKDKNKQFQYGNYNRYYGYRNPNSEVDLRLQCFASYRDLFLDKDVLDIGCNIGHVTLSVARDFAARSVTGIDIDKKLVNIARKNVRHYVKSSETPPHGESPIVDGSSGRFRRDECKSHRFPYNVTFKHGSYVLEDDSLLCAEHQQFDMILCLSVTKWVHLNWGDAGIKQMFKRIYAQLRPGGKLVLEPQNWSSYKSKKKLTETIYKNYNSIEFFPENFTQYLLSPEVGFAKSEVMGFSQHKSKGFRRPIQIYTKSALSPSVTSSARVTSSPYISEGTEHVYVTAQASANVITTQVQIETESQ